MIDFDLSQIQYWYWFILGIAMFVIEVLMPGAFCLWIGIAAVIVGGAAYFFAISLNMQILIFAAASIIVTIIGRRFYTPSSQDSTQSTLNRRVAQLIGKQFSLTEPIVNGITHVSISDAIWKLKGDDLPLGTLVEVVAIEGNTLVVKKVKQ